MSSMIKKVLPAFENQRQTTDFMLQEPRVFDTSDPGTGKTRSLLDTIYRLQTEHDAGRALLFAPKSILVPAWFNDAKKFTPELQLSVATAKNRAKAFMVPADVYVTNHDAVKWVEQNLDLSSFDIIGIDESTAFKHRTSQRSKAMARIIRHFKYRYLLTGTPNPNTVLDLWHQLFLLDDGERLTPNFFKFRNTVCEPTQVGPDPTMVKWHDKPGSEEAVADIISDITIRHKFEECHDIPKNSIHMIEFDLTPAHLKMYNKLRDEAVLEVKDKTVTAVHAGSLANKLLQAASGTVYNVEHEAVNLATERYELAMQLADEREQCVIAFAWTHQRDQLIKIAERMGHTYAVIDGSVTDKKRQEAVENFQNGEIKDIFIQPQSGAHGLTLTKGTTTIWPSPIHNAEHFVQFNRRIYRAGQTRKTETLLIAANETCDARVYDALQGKLNKMFSLLDILQIDPEET